MPSTLLASGSWAGWEGADRKCPPPPICKCRLRRKPARPGPDQRWVGWAWCAARYLLLGRLVLEAGVLDVVGPDGLVLLILGAQVLHGLGDGQPAALDVLTADPVGRGRGEGYRGPGAGVGTSSLHTQAGTATAALERARATPSWGQAHLGTRPTWGQAHLGTPLCNSSSGGGKRLTLGEAP